MASSAIQNNGLALIPSSLERVADKPYILYVIAGLIILGNTGAPICLRFLTVSIFRCTNKYTKTHECLGYLLAEPRHFYTHMFSSVHTLWLSISLVVLLSIQIAITAPLDWPNPVFTNNTLFGELSWDKRIANIVFQASSTRTAGLNSVDLQSLSFATTYIILVCMYISTSPVTLTMRSTNVRSVQTLKKQMTVYFTEHVSILVVAGLVILLLETKTMKTDENPCESSEACDLRAHFSFYKILFEIVSAYGTVGLSLGSTVSPNSFCTDWTKGSQLLLCAIMLLGRARGLPLSIDHAFNMDFRTATDADSDIVRHCPTAPALVEHSARGTCPNEELVERSVI